MNGDGSEERKGKSEYDEGFFHEAQFEWLEITRNRDPRLVLHSEPG